MGNGVSYDWLWRILAFSDDESFSCFTELNSKSCDKAIAVVCLELSWRLCVLSIGGPSKFMLTGVTNDSVHIFADSQSQRTP